MSEEERQNFYARLYPSSMIGMSFDIETVYEEIKFPTTI